MIIPGSRTSIEDVVRHYDRLDDFYRDIWGDHLHHGYWERKGATKEEAVLALIDLAARTAQLSRGDRVCDVGCGYGSTSAYLASQHDAEVTGITLSAHQQRYATEHYATGRCRFVLGDWLDNDFGAEVFDVVIGIECFAHMSDKPRFFEEAWRVLVPGGRVVLCVWLAGEYPSAWEIRRLLEPICSEARLASLPNVGEVRTMAADAGFRHSSVEILTPKVRRTWNICARRLAWRLLTDRRYQRYLMDARSSDRAFVRTIARIMIAYRTGAMEYGLLSARK